MPIIETIISWLQGLKSWATAETIIEFTKSLRVSKLKSLKVYAQFWPELGPVKIPSHFFWHKEHLTKALRTRLRQAGYTRMQQLTFRRLAYFSYFRINCILMGF